MRWPFELNPGYGLLQTDTSAVTVTTQQHREALLSPSLWIRWRFNYAIKAIMGRKWCRLERYFHIQGVGMQWETKFTATSKSRNIFYHYHYINVYSKFLIVIFTRNQNYAIRKTRSCNNFYDLQSCITRKSNQTITRLYYPYIKVYSELYIKVQK